MRRLIVISFILMQCFSVKGQFRFFTLLPGWTSNNIFEYQNYYVSVGLGSFATYENFVQLNLLNKNGLVMHENYFRVDSLESTEINYNTNCSYKAGNKRYVVGSCGSWDTTINQFRIHGLVLRYDNFFLDTVYVKLIPDYSNFQKIDLIYSSDSLNFLLGTEYNPDSTNIIKSYLSKRDSNMNVIWDKNFSCPGDCFLLPTNITDGPNGGYFFSVLENYRNGTGGDDEDKVNIIRTDALGNQIWRKKFGGDTVKNNGGWVVPSDDGNYFTAWSFNTYAGQLGNAAPSSTIFLCKFDSNGGIIWEHNLKSYLDIYTPNNYYNASQMQLLSNGNVLISGNSLLNGDVFLLEVDQNGNPIWYRSYNFFDNDVPSGSDYSFLYGVTHTSDGGFICTGQYNSVPCSFFPGGINKAFALKLDSMGCLTENCVTGINGIDATSQLNYLVYPNPATNYISIKRLQAAYGGRDKIELYDLQGRLVFLVTAKDDITRIPVEQMATGMYLLRVTDKNDSEIFSEKVVVER